MHGEIPYKDFSMESPPIIDYMMVPAQLVGGESYQYAALLLVVQHIHRHLVLRVPAPL